MKITRADRHFGTDRVMVWPNEIQLRSLQGRQYSEVRDIILELSNGETKFYHRIPPDDPLQPVKEIEVDKEEW